jgi:mono/diheme cytochrome c family protein
MHEITKGKTCAAVFPQQPASKPAPAVARQPWRKASKSCGGCHGVLESERAAALAWSFEYRVDGVVD